MEVHRLPFATIHLLQPNLAEVIVDADIEIDLKMVGIYHTFLLGHLKAPFCLLINKINSYSYTADAMGKIADLKEIKAMAVISYSHSTELVTQVLATFPRDNDWNLEVFTSRDDALAWLAPFIADEQSA